MKLSASILVVLVSAVVPARACDSIVVQHPLLAHHTMAFVCGVPEEEMPIAKPVPRSEVKKAKKRVQSKSRMKKRCWYTNKYGKRKYRLRYSCN